MNAPHATQCPPQSMLSDFGLGKLDAARAETVSQHLETCIDCRQRVANLSGDSFVNRLRGVPGRAAQPGRIEHTFIAGDSASNAAHSSETPWGKRPRLPGAEDGLPRPSPSVGGEGKRDGLESPSSVAAPPELANHPDYELIKEIGRGGMGVVYLAKNRMMDRLEVLKVVSKSLLDKPGALERFQQEIRSAAKLAHANIVGAYTVLRPGDLLVFAMEYVPGNDLMQVVKKRGYLPVANAAFYAHQVALGLQHAHEKGMVHRDIKPNNLMLAIEGKKHVVKILDFGLAKATSEKAAETALTKSGQMLGTPDYIAPEQTLDAHQADIRADIYSLGCTLYYFLAGRPPFQEASLYALLEAHQRRDAQLLNLVRPDVPVELAAVVAKMLAKDPAKRYQTPIEVARALTPFFKPGQATSAALPPRADTQPSHVAAEPEQGPASPTEESLTAQSAAVIPLPVAPAAIPAGVARIHVAQKAPDLGITIDTHRAGARRRGGWRAFPPWQRLALAGGAAAALVLGVVLLIHTPNGTVKIELSVPNAKVTLTVDKNTIKLDDLDHPLTLTVGEHDLKVTGKGYETYTKKFSVTKGKNAPLTITLLPQKKEVQSSQNEKVQVPANKRFDFEIPESSRGCWLIQGDELVQGSLDNKDVNILFGKPDWDEFDFSVEIKLDRGQDGCRTYLWHQDFQNMGDVSLAADGNTRHLFAEKHEGSWSVSASRQGSLTVGRWYRVDVRVRGTHGDCFLDGARLLSFDAEHRVRGRIGLGTLKTAYRFRNIVVRTPDGKVLLEGLPDVELDHDHEQADKPSVSLGGPESIGAKRLAAGCKSSWLPDGEEVLVSAVEGGIDQVDIESGAVTHLISRFGWDAAASPSGKLIAYVRCGPGGHVKDELFLNDADGRNMRKLADGGWPSWSSDGNTVYFHSRKDALVKAVDVTTSQIAPRDVVPLKESLYPTVSPDGKSVGYVADGSLVVINRETTNRLIRDLPRAKHGYVAWSRDSKRLAYSGAGMSDEVVHGWPPVTMRQELADSDEAGLWLLDLASGATKQILAGPYTMPAWSPDGKWLSFDLRAPGRYEVFALETAKLDTLQPVPQEAKKDHEREVAEWVLSRGGKLRINSLPHIDITDKAKLPTGPVQLTAINMERIPVADDEVACIHDLSLLSELDLRGPLLTDDGVAKLQRLPMLSRLWLGRTKITDSGVGHLVEFKCLDLLDLTGTRVGDDGLKQVVDGLLGLREVDLDDTRVTNKAIESFAKLRLVQLAIGGSVDDAGLARLSEVAPALIALDLSGDRITNDGIRSLKNFSILGRLGISCKWVDDDGLRELKNDSLEALTINASGITGKGLKHLAKLPRLKSLRMFAPPVYDHDLAALRECRALSHLALFNQSSAYLTDLSLAHLQQTGLTEIIFDNSNVTQRGVDALRAALPNCKVTCRINAKK